MDGKELDLVWSGWGPAVLHLLAYSLQQLLCGTVAVATRACQTSLSVCGRGLSWLLLATGVLAVSLCSSLGLLLACLAVLLQVSPSVPG